MELYKFHTNSIRVSVTDLIKSQTVTLPVESASNISRIAVSPDGTFLLTVDENQRCHFINLHCHVVLHRVRFKYPVNAVLFSPNGKYIAVGTGKLVQIWRSPGFKKEVFAFELIRTLADCNDKVTVLNWSPDSKYLLVGSKDLAVRLFYVKEKLKGVHSNKAFLLLGHRDSVVSCFFSIDKKTDKVNRIYTIARDCYMFSWGFSGNDGKFDETMEEAEPPSPGTPEREGEGKNRKDFDGKDEELSEEQEYLRKIDTRSLTELITAILQRVGDDIDRNNLPIILYEDEDHDKVVLASDSDLAAAVDHARSAGWKGLRLHLDCSGTGGRRRGYGSESLDYVHQDAWAAAYSAVAPGAAVVAGLGLMAYLKRAGQ